MKTTVWFALLFPLTSFANTTMVQDCHSLAGATPRMTVQITDTYNDAHKFLSSRIVFREEGKDPRKIAAKKSSRQHPTLSYVTIVTWQASQFKLDGYFVLEDPRRNFTGVLTRSPGEELRLSCTF
jgi:hypothetical protein